MARSEHQALLYRASILAYGVSNRLLSVLRMRGLPTVEAAPRRNRELRVSESRVQAAEIPLIPQDSAVVEAIRSKSIILCTCPP